MKRAFTFLCAVVLLLTSFSPVAVQAAKTDTALSAVDSAAEVASEEALEALTSDEAKATVTDGPVELETIQIAKVASSTEMPKNYRAPREEELGDEFRNYIKAYVAQCAYDIPVSQYKLPVSAFEDVCNFIFYESPELFSPSRIGGTGDGEIITTIKIKEYQTFADTPEEYAACLQGIQSARDYLVRGVKGNASLSEEEKALILHDRLAAWTEYDLGIYLYSGYEKNEIYTAVGPLANQSGVCQGYALAYTYLLKEAGVESDLCLSDALNHAWNIVYIDGVAYHVDVTWDDPTNMGSDNTLKNTYYDHYGRVRHENFLLSSDGIWNSGHQAYDYNTTPYDTRYDYSGWWRNTDTAVVLVGDDRLFYRHKNDGHIYQYDNGAEWVAAYTDGYSGQLTANGTTLLYNTQKEVYTVDTSNGSNNPLWAPDSIQNSNGYIEGLKYEKGKVWVQLHDGIGYSWRESMDLAEQGASVRIITQPKSVVAGNGQVAKITVKATGDGLTYTWYHKSAQSANYSVSSLTGATYAVRVSSAVHGRYVYCVVTDAYGNTATSNVVRVYMGNTAKVVTQPKSVKTVAGKTAKITVKATGDGLKYQWYYAAKGSTSFKKLSGATAATYSVKMSSKVNGRQVYCVITDKYGNSVKSAVATLTQAKAATITTQPTNAAAPKNKTVKVTVKASGEGLKYQWYYSNKGWSTFKKLSARTTSYSVKMTSAVNGRRVYCVVTDKYGVSVKSKVVTLYLGKPVTIKTQPASVKAPAGKTVSVKVTASGSGLKYVWYQKYVGTTKWVKTSVTKNKYSMKVTAANAGRQVYCVITDKYGISVKSKTVTFKLAPPPEITSQPQDTGVAKGKNARVVVRASGEGLTYTWYYRNKGAAKWKKLSNTGTSYKVKMSKSVDGRQVYCLVKDKYGATVKSRVATLRMFDPVKQITGDWYSYMAYGTYGGYNYSFYDAEMKIYSSGKTSIYVERNNGMFTSGNFTYYFEYNSIQGNDAYYYMYNNAGSMTGIYNLKERTFTLLLNDGSYIVFER